MITPGPQHRCWHPGAEQDVPDLGPGTQVRVQPLARRAQAAQVDDPADPGAAGKGREGFRGCSVGGLEHRAGAQRVDQEVRNVHPGQFRPQGSRVKRVGLGHLDLADPREARQPAALRAMRRTR